MANSSLDIKMQDLKLSDSPVPALSPDVTPAETHTSVFETSTPLLDRTGDIGNFDQENQEAEVEELLEYDDFSLKSADVKTDPILADLARKQGRASSQGGHVARPASAVFKARPAPNPTRQGGLGPRMTKSAALRQGLDWAALSSPVKRSTTSASESSKVQYHVPGQKREDGKVQVASLAAPTIAPRATKASMLRTGAGGEAGATTPLKKDYAAQALANKARDKEERERRRKSIALPASLSAPSIAPRQNRSSALRAGAPAPVSTRALTNTTADNVDRSKPEPKDPKAGLARRVSMGVKSLGTPSIAPRLNRAALLRAPGSSTLLSAPKPTDPATSKAVPATPKRTPSNAPSATSSKPSATRPASAVSPRPTKASLLRAGLGAKVYSREI